MPSNLSAPPITGRPSRPRVIVGSVALVLAIAAAITALYSTFPGDEPGTLAAAAHQTPGAPTAPPTWTADLSEEMVEALFADAATSEGAPSRFWAAFTDDELVAIGYEMCAELDSAAGPLDSALTIMDRYGATADDAGWLMGAATASLCDEHWNVWAGEVR